MLSNGKALSGGQTDRLKTLLVFTVYSRLRSPLISLLTATSKATLVEKIATKSNNEKHEKDLVAELG